VARQYEAGQALNMAATLEIDAVIDPADTRRLAVARALASGPGRPDRHAGLAIDTW
jgi:acetyl-CoA carboxylase carboxyltransferase component